METEIWNREELYSEVWEKSLVKLGAKYRVSAEMVGKAWAVYTGSGRFISRASLGQ